MNTANFLKDLKNYADRCEKSWKVSIEFFDYLDSHYQLYMHATSEERDEIRAFIRAGSKEKNKLKSFYNRFFQPNNIPYLLLMYVKQRVLEKVRLTGDKEWLIRGLAAISMEDFAGKFEDKPYIGYPMQGDARFLLADLWVTAQENGIEPEPIFKNIADISDERNKTFGLPMQRIMAGELLGQLIYERKTEGKFVGLF